MKYKWFVLTIEGDWTPCDKPKDYDNDWKSVAYDLNNISTKDTKVFIQFLYDKPLYIHKREIIKESD